MCTIPFNSVIAHNNRTQQYDSTRKDNLICPAPYIQINDNNNTKQNKLNLYNVG